MRCLLLLFSILFAVAAHGATRYVNPAHSNSRDSGAGASTAPYKTISFAMKQLVSGDRLIIASGTYRETLSFKYQAQNVVVEGSAGTLVKGSDVVTGWESAGGGRFVRRNWTVNTQQVFVNGVQMKQIGGAVAAGYQWPGRFSGSASSMTPESFYYDAGSGVSMSNRPADRFQARQLKQACASVSLSAPGLAMCNSGTFPSCIPTQVQQHAAPPLR
jgi:hypothetical protein